MADIKQLKENLKEIGLLESARAVLHWDQETYMPEGGGEFRAKQMAYISSLIHKKITGPKFKKLLSQFVNLEDGQVKLDEVPTIQKRMLEETYRDYRLAAALRPVLYPSWQSILPSRPKYGRRPKNKIVSAISSLTWKKWLNYKKRKQNTWATKINP